MGENCWFLVWGRGGEGGGEVGERVGGEGGLDVAVVGDAGVLLLGGLAEEEDALVGRDAGDLAGGQGAEDGWKEVVSSGGFF